MSESPNSLLAQDARRKLLCAKAAGTWELFDAKADPTDRVEL